MHEIDLILTLTGGLAGALIFGIITQRFGMSPIVGYLLAGIAIGPYTPGYVADRPLAEQMAEIGVILLMFGVGLHFHLKELLAVRWIAIPGALVQSAIATGLGIISAELFGWGFSAGLVFGLALSVASTVVLLRVLADHSELHTPAGHIAVGWLIVEDLFTVFVLVVLPVFFADIGANANGISAALINAVVKITLLIAGVFFLGGKVIPWLLTRAADSRSRELFSLTVLVIALGISVGAAKLFGVSMALGAFLAGMIVGRSEFSMRAAADVLPMRDAFAVIFFVSVGMLLDPMILIEQWPAIIVALGIVIVGKPIAALAIMALLRYPLRDSLVVSVALAQIGEFSFILGALGRQLGVFPATALNILVAAAIISITVNPLLFRSINQLHLLLLRTSFGQRLNARTREAAPHRAGRHSAIVIGYGPVGQTVVRLLQENAIDPTVIELNFDAVRGLRDEGIEAVYGDATDGKILANAGIKRAESLLLTAAGISEIEQIVRIARELNPRIRIFARTAYVKEIFALRQLGVENVFSEEGEVALALASEILHQLGASPDQIDRERERVHVSLFGRAAE